MDKTHYRKIVSVKQTTWLIGAPAEIDQGILLADDAAGQSILQLSLRNVSFRTIEEMEIEITGFPAAEEKSGPLRLRYVYSKLKAAHGSTFGKGKAIVLGNQLIQDVQIIFRRAHFSNATIWQNDILDPGLTLHLEELTTQWPNQKILELKQRLSITNGLPDLQLRYVPYQSESHWLCSCGFPNTPGRSACGRCDQNRDRLFGLIERIGVDQPALPSEIKHDPKPKTPFPLPQPIRQSVPDNNDQGFPPEAPALPSVAGKRLRTTVRAVLLGSLILLFSSLGYVMLTNVIPTTKYNQAVAEFESGNFAAAADQFIALGEFHESPRMVLEARYAQAQTLLTNGAFSEAAPLFKELGSFKDSMTKEKLAIYAQGQQELATGSFEAAVTTFRSLGDFQDSPKQALESSYQAAVQLLAEGDYGAASAAFAGLGIYKDSAAQSEEARYQLGMALLADNRPEEAIQVLTKLSSHNAWVSKLTEAAVSLATLRLNEKKYDEALAAISITKSSSADILQLKNQIHYALAQSLDVAGNLDGARDHYAHDLQYMDSQKRYNALTYQIADQLETRGEPTEAAAEFLKIKDYQDSKERSGKILYQMAADLQQQGNDEAAAKLYSQISFYRDARDKAESIWTELAKASEKGLNYLRAAEYYTQAGKAQTAARVKAYGDAIAAFARKDYVDTYNALVEEVGYYDKHNYSGLTGYKDSVAYFVYSAIESYMEEYEMASAEDDYQFFYSIQIYNLYKQAKKYADFKDLSKFLSEDLFRYARLVGTWKSGSNNFRLYFTSSGEVRTFYNLPHDKGMYFIFDKDIMKLGSDSAGWHNVFRITQIDSKTIRVYSYKADKTYTLYRQ